MDKNAIKKYAVWARRELISRVSGRAAWYGITEDRCVDADADSIDGRVISATEKKQRAAFITKVQREGYEQAIEEVAYTWFNRFCALRYMEVNGYLPSHVRVFTNDANEFKPQIIDEAIHLEIDGLDKEKILAYKDANDTEGLYRYLLITQCNALSSILPGMFQKIEDYTELLLPENLLRDGSVIERMIVEIPEEDWTDQVQIIGWLYQYYNVEKKDEVFAALKKNVKITKENIPAATQLFTPDWIVRYMVENSLGRLWIEGHPNNKLKSSWKYYIDEAEQEPEVEEQLAEIRKEYAELKPEDIKCIDPCCGSGHILVYMFDVLMQIYKSYGYTTQESVTSIINFNLYGLDIDERAAQLAYFAVMMKARSYDSLYFNCEIQPHVYAICESNDLDKTLTDYYEGNSPKLKADFEVLITDLYDAKEYGSVLKISNVDFNALLTRANELSNEISFYASAISEQILPLIYVGQILAQKYHIVVTNPPYMGNSGMCIPLSNFVKKFYPDSKSDLFAVFIERCGQMLKENGFQAMITQPSLLSLSSFEKLRKKIYIEYMIISLLDMGRGIFGVDFGSTSFIFRKTDCQSYRGIYFNLKKRIFQYLNPDDICTLFLAAKRNHKIKYDFNLYNTDEKIKLDPEGENAQRIYYTAQQLNFFKIPGSPMAYWASDSLLKAFEKEKISDYGIAKVGIGSGNTDYFLKMWYEINLGEISFNSSPYDIDKIKYAPINKGGNFRKWYGNNEYVINWNNNGKEIKEYSDGKGRKLSYPRNLNFQLKESLTWGDVSSGDFSMRFSPVGFFFSDVGNSLFLFDKKDTNYILGFCNSKPFNSIAKLLNQTMHFKPGNMLSMPLIYNGSYQAKVNSLVSMNIHSCRDDWNSFETSWDFQCHPLVRWSKDLFNTTYISTTMEYYYGSVPEAGSPIELCFLLWQGECLDRFEKVKTNEVELNRIFIKIYNLQGELSPEIEDKDITVRKADLQRDIKSLISYAVGCMFGRYSIDVDGLTYAGGEWDTSKYDIYQPDHDGILPICDDEYFTDDIVGRFVDFIQTVYGSDTLEENLQFIADALGGKGSSREVIRKYFLNDFFADHCKIYQKRPIYWLFDSGKKNGFKCLIYLHRYQPDTLARIRTDYVHEQQARYRTAIADLENRIEAVSSSDRIKLNKELKKVQEQADELHDYEEKIHHLADQFIDINLDDGVKVNYAKFQDVLAKIK